jgi:hypothetical protein
MPGRKRFDKITYCHHFMKRVFSIVFEVSHPHGPIGRYGAAGEGPGAGLIVLAMPLEGPQLFEPYFAGRKVQEQTAQKSIVSVQTISAHLRIVVPLLAVIDRWPVCF